jgi:hypothetical protein
MQQRNIILSLVLVEIIRLKTKVQSGENRHFKIFSVNIYLLCIFIFTYSSFFITVTSHCS